MAQSFIAGNEDVFAVTLLAGQRIQLASILEADIETIISWDNDPEYLRLLHSGPSYPRPEIAQKDWWRERLRSKAEYHFAIRLIEEKTLIGTVSFTEFEWLHRVAWLAIGLGRSEYRGFGYGTEAMQLILEFAFDNLNLHRISLSVFGYNEPAIRLYERLGFQREGIFREYLERAGKRHDMLLYGLLAPEWRAMRASLD